MFKIVLQNQHKAVKSMKADFGGQTVSTISRACTSVLVQRCWSAGLRLAGPQIYKIYVIANIALYLFVRFYSISAASVCCP